ncbi:hypothetical protein [Clostridium sp. ZS2-4]|uniref:hypothetical protein n=1 Tax=Clostridium sp. ZS2-4 TaxID=2987703 RepID=UPI00227D2E5F|nr:hypothetical protein [Clostridium sp. ZS2-4]MCY6354332.1 hypothetical protein [Clostridium sp. ZS2-4]
MDIVEKENIKLFVKNYFKSLRIKQFLIITLISIISAYLTKGKEELIISIVIISIISLVAFFTYPDFLQKETEKAIQTSYNKISKHDNELVIICNLKKFNGPTFGALHIDEKTIEFKPFRDNLQSERFLIKETEIKNIKISLLKIKSSVFNRIFYKELNKAISFSGNSIKVLLQTLEPEKTIEKIRKKIHIS